jgi:hypothetical protein
MTSSSGFARGDVVTVEFPFSDGSAGKDRPCLVIAGPSAYSLLTVKRGTLKPAAMNRVMSALCPALGCNAVTR